MQLEIPEWMLKRNNPNVAKVGLENTGIGSLNHAKECLGLTTFSDSDILDIGCGVRFTATFINREISVKSYTGVELVRELVDFLNKEVAQEDSRFRYIYWNVHNARYNRAGTPMGEFKSIPQADAYDIIWAWSVFTHLNPDDAYALLMLSRNHARPESQLFFSAFIDDDVLDFEDRDPVNTLTYAYYNRQYMTSLIEKSGWTVKSFHEPNPEGWVQSSFVCSPV